MMIAALFISLFILILIGVPISFSLAISPMIAFGFFSDLPVLNLVQKMFRAVDSFTLLAIPFFVFSGNVMAYGGVSRKLTNLASAFVGKLTGGLAMITTVSCAFFGAISGSAPATTSAIGSVMVGQMKDRGYAPDFTAACVASSGTIGLLIPPSVTMVLYGAIAGASIGKLFLGGVVPGLIMTAAICLVNYGVSKKRGYRGTDTFSVSGIFAALKDGIWAILMPVFIMGGIYGGIFTPTEAAAVAVIYGIIVSVFVYRQLGRKQFVDVMFASASSTGNIMFLVACAHLFSYLLASEQIPQQFAAFMMSISDSLIIIQLMMMFALLVVGTFLDNAVAMVLLTPIFFPVIAGMGGDLVFFGVLMVFALAIGQVTPPVGLCLFVACNMSKQPIEKVSLQVIPYVFVLLGVLLLLNFVPPLVTFIPSLANW
jgi:C4-dicarboxylate transporter DctM subunit